MHEIWQQIIFSTLIAALLAGAGIGGRHFTVGDGAPETVLVDKDSLCRTDAPLEAHSIVLIDTTDRLSPAQQRMLRQVIDSEARGVVPYEKLSVFTVDEGSPYEPKRLFEACAPKNAGDAEGVAENPRLFGAIWARKFGKPLDQTIAAEAGSGPQEQSPLIETLFGLSLLYDFGADLKRRRLVVVSDMLQNSDGLSLYDGPVEYARYVRTPHGELHRADLEGVEVAIHYIVRPRALRMQSVENRRFWLDFFHAAGARAETRGAPGRRTGDETPAGGQMAGEG